MSAAAVQRLAQRNETEAAILDAARAAIAQEGYDRLTMNGLAQRAYVSRTNVYFYFANKRAVVDRLVQQAFAEMLVAGAPYLDGSGDPRRELRIGLARVVGVVNNNAHVLLLAGKLSGAEDGLPTEWQPYVRRLVRAAERRIRSDQMRGRAPNDIDAGIASRALMAMVERHITHEVINGQQSVTESVRTLAELWYRAVYLFPPAADAVPVD
jgi:AcrR family transcriptional regulator